MNWIRIAVKMKTDPKVGAIAAACGVPMAHAVGMVCCALMEFPDHARDGDVAGVPDVVLEQWAGWLGKGGVFASVFRAQMCDDTGAVAAWDRHNGAAIREADATKERAKQWRAERQAAKRERVPNGAPNGSRTAYDTRTERVANGVANGKRTPLRDGTGRDEELTTPLRAVVSSGGAAQDGTPPLSFVTESHHHAFVGYWRAHQYPAALVATLEAMANGMQGPAVAWDTIGAALVEMQGAGARFSPATLRAFVRRLQDTPAGKPLTWDDLMVPTEVRDVA